jgi:hypothetical protein
MALRPRAPAASTQARERRAGRVGGAVSCPRSSGASTLGPPTASGRPWRPARCGPAGILPDRTFRRADSRKHPPRGRPPGVVRRAPRQRCTAGSRADGHTAGVVRRRLGRGRVGSSRAARRLVVPDLPTNRATARRGSIVGRGAPGGRMTGGARTLWAKSRDLAQDAADANRPLSPAASACPAILPWAPHGRRLTRCPRRLASPGVLGHGPGLVGPSPGRAA